LLSSRLVFALFWASTATAGNAQPTIAAVPDAVRQRELVRLVRQDCGSCHGMTLQGGLGPALLPANLQEKSADGLVATIYYGRPGTPMPPWKQFMSEAEAAWIVQKLMGAFPQ
jgi:cytochrome c55X